MNAFKHSRAPRRSLVGALGTTCAFVLILAAAASAAPPVAVDDLIVTDEDTQVSFNVLANDSDPDGDPLTVTGNTSPSHGGLACGANGDCSYFPDQDYHGPDSFTYDVSDGKGGTDTARVEITVNSVNDRPRAESDDITTDEDTPVTRNVLANDSDVDGDGLQVTGWTNGDDGTVSCTPDGDCTYTPAAGDSGGDIFSYTVSDGNGGTDTADVDVSVRPVNDPPNAVDDALTTDQDTPGGVNVLANDTDPEGDALSVTGSTNGAHGTVACTPAGDCTYTPDTGYSGPDSFTYTVSDGRGGTDTATVGVTVRAVSSGGRVAGKGSFNRTTLYGIDFRVDASASGGFFEFDGNRLTFHSTFVDRFTTSGNQAGIDGHGSWNGTPGYSYEARFVDRGFPGRNDTIELVVRDPSGAVAFATDGPRLLKRGNIEVTG